MKPLKYITRGWKDSDWKPHPMLRIIPPIVFDILAWFVVAVIILAVLKWAVV